MSTITLTLVDGLDSLGEDARADLDAISVRAFRLVAVSASVGLSDENLDRKVRNGKAGRKSRVDHRGRAGPGTKPRGSTRVRRCGHHRCRPVSGHQIGALPPGHARGPEGNRG